MTTTFRSFSPPARTLMGPGPSDVHPRVLQAMARPTIGHLDPKFVELMDDVKALLQHVFKTKNRLTLPISAPGSAGMEAAIANLVEPGDTVVVCENGVFGKRMTSIVERCGGKPVVVKNAWGTPVDPNDVEKALRSVDHAKAVAFVHAETSTGARSDAKTLAALAHQHDALAIVDTVTGLGGIEVDVDGWNLDAVYSGSQKCISCPPGLAPLTFGERAAEVVRTRKTPCVSWFLDLNLVMGYWNEGAKRTYHHTAPVNAIYGLHEALVMVAEEGIENAWARHRRNHEALRDGLVALGLDYVVAPEYRLPQLNSVKIPAGVDDAAVRKMLLDEWNLEIGGGLGDLAGKAWRIGLMGYASRPENVYRCLSALEASLAALGAKIERGRAVDAARARYASEV